MGEVANEAHQRIQAFRGNRKADAYVSKCLNPARVRGVYRPCRRCTSCAYATALEKTARLRAELHPALPSYFVTLTYADPAWEANHLPEKPEGEYTPEQRKVIKQWQDKVYRLRLRYDAAQDRGAPSEFLQSLRDRLEYREARLADFKDKAARWYPRRPSIRRRDSKLWQKRMQEELQRENPDARLPRMVIKHELGSHGTRRPHIHVLMLHATPGELRAAVVAWGHLFNDANQRRRWRHGLEPKPFPEAEQHLEPAGRGHVHILPVTDEGVSAYVTKDLYRGQDAEAWEYTVKGVEAPCIIWPRNPGIGCGGWLEYLRARWRQAVEAHGLGSVELELALQDSRHKGTSIRHRSRAGYGAGTRDAQGLPVKETRIEYDKAPPSVWAKFLAEIEQERNPEARHLVREFLTEEWAHRDGELTYIMKQRHEALRAALKRLRNWSELCARKGVELPTYGRREQAYIRRRQVELGCEQLRAEPPEEAPGGEAPPGEPARQ